MTFTHVVMFKWRDDSVDAAAIAAALQAAVAAVDGVERYLCGPDAGVAPGAYDFAVVGTFTDRAAFATYRDDPEHQRIIAEMIAPHVDTRTVVQLES